MSTSTPLAVSTQGLGHAFGKVLALRDLDLRVPEGCVSAFLGPNGAGKTTAIRLLLGLLKVRTGSATVLGLPPGHPQALARIGALVESPSLYPHLTGRENVEITRLMRNAPRFETDRVLGMVGLLEAAGRLVKGYSLGMRQRLGLALALMGEPRLVVLDEPTNGLDPSGIAEVRELICRLPRETGATVLVSSHLLAEVELMAEHLVVIHKGLLRFQGPLATFGGEAAVVLVRVNDAPRAQELLSQEGLTVTPGEAHLRVEAPPEGAHRIAALLVRAGLDLHELVAERPSLERRFLTLVEGA